MTRYTVKGNVWGYLVWDNVADKAASPYTYLQDATKIASKLNEDDELDKVREARAAAGTHHMVTDL